MEEELRREDNAGAPLPCVPTRGQALLRRSVSASEHFYISVAAALIKATDKRKPRNLKLAQSGRAAETVPWSLGSSI